MEVWDKLVQMKEDKCEFEVTVEGVVKGGVIAYVEGIRAFIPISKLALHYVENPEDYLKKTLNVRVFEVDEQENRLILSAREILKEKEAYTGSDAYIERAAREKFGWVKDGEIIFRKQEDEGAANAQPTQSAVPEE